MGNENSFKAFGENLAKGVSKGLGEVAENFGKAGGEIIARLSGKGNFDEAVEAGKKYLEKTTSAFEDSLIDEIKIMDPKNFSLEDMKREMDDSTFQNKKIKKAWQELAEKAGLHKLIQEEVQWAINDFKNPELDEKGEPLSTTDLEEVVKALEFAEKAGADPDGKLRKQVNKMIQEGVQWAINDSQNTELDEVGEPLSTTGPEEVIEMLEFAEKMGADLDGKLRAQVNKLIQEDVRWAINDFKNPELDEKGEPLFTTDLEEVIEMLEFAEKAGADPDGKLRAEFEELKK